MRSIIKSSLVAIVSIIGLLVTMTSWVHADEIRVGVADFPFSRFNPWASPNQPGVFVVSTVFDGLTRVGPDGEPLPWLANSWSSQDSKTWRFDLRDDVVFSNGRPFMAEDVKKALDYLTSPLTQREVVAQNFASVTDVKLTGPHSVQITLSEPDILFPRTASQLLIPDSHAWNELGAEAFAMAPIGTGPFTVESMSDDRIHFSQNDRSWRRPSSQRMEFIALTDSSSRLNGIMSGGIDIAFNMGPDDISVLDTGNARLYVADLPIVYGFVFISNKPQSPLQSVSVRQALNYAVNTDEIISIALAGYARPASQPTHHKTFGYDPELKPYGYDPVKAKALLSEAGYSNGFDLIAEITLSGPIEALVLQKVADDLSKVGVNLTLQTITYATFASNFRTGMWKGDAFNLTFSAEPNLDALRSIRYHSCDWPARWYCDEDIMPAIRLASSQQAAEERLKLTQGVMAHYRREAPAIFLYEMPHFIALSNKVQGFTTVHSFIRWDQVSLLD